MKSPIPALSNVGLIGALVAGALTACGPSLEPGGVMSPEERLQEQEMMAYESEKDKRGNSNEDLGPVEEETTPFDEKQAKMELKRASRSASTCDDVVMKDEKGKKGKKEEPGKADINIVFSPDGSVKDANISGRYSDGQVGDCILNAYKAVIVPPFDGEDYSMSWVLDMSGKVEQDEETSKLQQKIFGGGEEEEEEESKDKKKPSSKKK